MSVQLVEWCGRHGRTDCRMLKSNGHPLTEKGGPSGPGFNAHDKHPEVHGSPASLGTS